MRSAIITQHTEMNGTRRIVISGAIIAAYVAIMMLTQGFAFGQYQIRIATALYSLSAIYPFLIGPLALGNMLSNLLMGGLGLPDIIGGGIVGLFTASAAYLIARQGLNDWLLALPIILFPGLLVPVWLSFLLGIPYQVLAASLLIGQIVPGIFGVLLVRRLRANFDMRESKHARDK